MTKAYGYIRVSGLSQLDHGGPERQRQAIQAYADSHDIQIVRFFEEAFTGKLADRVALAEMRGLILDNGVRTVIIEKLDRLARDLMIKETIICDFRKNQIQLLSTAEPDLCSDEPSRKFFRQIMGAVAEFDRAMLTARMQSGKNRILATGKKCGGRLHYGERSPEERAVIDMILACREARMNYSQIALKLAAAGLKTRAGTNFSPTQVIRILRREKQSCLPSSQSLPSSESDSSSPTTKDGVVSVS